MEGTELTQEPLSEEQSPLEMRRIIAKRIANFVGVGNQIVLPSDDSDDTTIILEIVEEEGQKQLRFLLASESLQFVELYIDSGITGNCALYSAEADYDDSEPITFTQVPDDENQDEPNEPSITQELYFALLIGALIHLQGIVDPKE